MHLNHDMALFLAGVAALSAGPLVYVLARRSRLERALHGLLVMAIAALVVFEILPECVSSAGWAALAAAALGVGVPLVAERGHGAPLQHAAQGVTAAAVLLAVLGVIIHGLTDGLALASSHEELHATGHGHGLLAALLLHRLPEGAALWWIASRRGTGLALCALGADALATGSGIWLGASAMSFVGTAWVALFQAFVGGVLLHVLLHTRPEPAPARA